MKAQLKERTLVSTRDFMRQFSSIIKNPKSKEYIIMNHGKPVASLTPQQSTDTDNWWRGLEQSVPVAQPPKKRISFSELEKLRFHSGEKNLNQKIDEIVYGIKR